MAPRPKSFEAVIDLARDDLTGDAFRAWHASVARRGLAEFLGGTDTRRVDTFVDGRRGASEDTVKLYGVIRYEFSRAAAVVRQVLDWLINEGNKVSPKYGESFAVGVIKAGAATALRGGEGAEGRLIPARQFNPDSRGIPTDAAFIIVNTRSWSRKVDVQMIGLQAMVFSIPPMILERAAERFRAQHRELIFKRWYTSTFTGQYILKTGKRRGEPVHSPALIIARAS